MVNRQQFIRYGLEMLDDIECNRKLLGIKEETLAGIGLVLTLASGALTMALTIIWALNAY